MTKRALQATKWATGLALGVIPADPSIPVTQMIGGAAPTEQGNPLTVLLDDIPETFPDQFGLFEIMVLVD